MFRDLLQRFRLFRRQRQQRQQRADLDRTDAAALATQAAPDPARLLVVRNDSIGDYLLYRPWLRRLSEVASGRGQRITCWPMRCGPRWPAPGTPTCLRK